MEKLRSSIILMLLVVMATTLRADEVDVPAGATKLQQSDMLDELDFDPTLIKETKAVQAIAEDLKTIDQPPLVQFLIDSSGSMGQELAGGKTKIYILKKILSKYLLAQWNERNSSGLRVFGSQRKKDCKDIKLLIPPGESQLGNIQKTVQDLVPVGMTPIGKSLEASYNDLKSYPGPKRIVLFTDGEETCGEDPCKIMRQIKESGTDLKVFVVALGLANQAETLLKLSCIGDMNTADNEQELDNMMSNLDMQLNPNKNLFVKSPDPEATVFLFKPESPKELYRKFSAGTGVEVPPGRYFAVVNLRPKYRFSVFNVPPKKKVTLTVTGEGYFKANFVQKLLKVELVDRKTRKVVKSFVSDERVALPNGRWDLRFYREPFFEKLVEDYLIVPDGEYVYDVNDAGAFWVEDGSVRGLYIYDNNEKIIGNYLTNFPFVLKGGTYQVKVDEKCFFKEVSTAGKREVVKLSCKN